MQRMFNEVINNKTKRVGIVEITTNIIRTAKTNGYQSSK